MLKKSITYTDFNDEKTTEDFFFHLSRAELAEIELSKEGGFSDSLKKIVDSNDGQAIIKEFKNIILKAYGVKSEDGKRFIKNDRLREEFESSEAYSVLFMELVTDADKAAEFVRGIVPEGMAEEAAAAVEGRETDPVEDEPTKRTVTPSEVERMSTEEFAELKQQINSGKAEIKGTMHAG